MAVGSWRARRRLERAFAIGIALFILSLILGSFGLAGLGAALVCVCLALLAIEGLRRIGR